MDNEQKNPSERNGRTRHQSLLEILKKEKIEIERNSLILGRQAKSISSLPSIEEMEYLFGVGGTTEEVRKKEESESKMAEKSPEDSRVIQGMISSFDKDDLLAEWGPGSDYFEFDDLDFEDPQKLENKSYETALRNLKGLSRENHPVCALRHEAPLPSKNFQMRIARVEKILSTLFRNLDLIKETCGDDAMSSAQKNLDDVLLAVECLIDPGKQARDKPDHIQMDIHVAAVSIHLKKTAETAIKAMEEWKRHYRDNSANKLSLDLIWSQGFVEFLAKSLVEQNKSDPRLQKEFSNRRVRSVVHQNFGDARMIHVAVMTPSQFLKLSGVGPATLELALKDVRDTGVDTIFSISSSAVENCIAILDEKGSNNYGIEMCSYLATEMISRNYCLRRNEFVSHYFDAYKYRLKISDALSNSVRTLPAL